MAGSSVRIAVITDAHANLPALRAVLDTILAEGCDEIVHTGDAVAIGPFPAECLDLLLSTPRVRPILGNHDAWFAHGLPVPRPAWMSEGEVEHQLWTHAQLGSTARSAVAQWPRVILEDVGPARVTFLHYALGAGPGEFEPIVSDPRPDDLDRLFARWPSDVVCYGHHHPASDLQGAARYVTPGSLGCYTRAVARYVVLEVLPDGGLVVSHRGVEYDDTALFRELELRRVPEREFIRRVFFPRAG